MFAKMFLIGVTLKKWQKVCEMLWKDRNKKEARDRQKALYAQAHIQLLWKAIFIWKQKKIESSCFMDYVKL